MVDQPRQVGLPTKLYYGFGSAAYGIKDNGFAYFLLLYYNQVLGLPAEWVGRAILIALVFDAISDPLVGHISDNFHSRWGRRHPFMYAAALPVGLSYLLIWNPPSGMSQEMLWYYLVGMAIFVRTMITLYEVPSTSLVPDLSDNYDERTSLLGYRYFFGWWGGLTIACLAYVIFFAPTEAYPNGFLNPEGWQAYGVVAAIIMFVAILVSAIGTHDRIPHLKPPPPKKAFNLIRTVSEIKETVSNNSFLVLFVASIFFYLAAGVNAGLNTYFNFYYWEFTTTEVLILTLLVFFSAAIALILAPRVSARVGKKQAIMMIGTVAISFAPLPYIARSLNLWPDNNTDTLLIAMGAFTLFEVALIISVQILIASMVADVVEESELKTSRRSEGVFYAARSFAQKCVSGLGIYFASIILGLISFPENAKPGEVDAAVIYNLGIVYAPMIFMLYLLGLSIITWYRIDRVGHQANLQRLSERTVAAAPLPAMAQSGGAKIAPQDAFTDSPPQEAIESDNAVPEAAPAPEKKDH